MKKSLTICPSLWRQLFVRPLILLSCTVLVLELLGSVFQWLFPVLQKYLVDALTAKEPQLSLLWLAAVVSVVVLSGCCLNLAAFCRGILSMRFRSGIKEELFRHLLALPEDFLHSRGAGYFFNRFQLDIGESANYVSGGILRTVPEAVKLLLALCTIGMVNLRCLPVILLFLLLQWAIAVYFRSIQYRLSGCLQECSAEERQLVQEFISRHRVVKTAAAGTLAQDKLSAKLSEWKKLTRKRLCSENVFRIALKVPVYLCLLIVIGTGLNGYFNGDFSLGTLWSLLLLVQMVFAPARQLGSMVAASGSACSAWSRLLELSRQPVESNAGKLCVKLSGEIRFDRLSFGYTPESKILSGLDLTIPEKTVFFLTGNNGSGKSTILALLLRLYSGQSGKITIGDENIENYTLSSYRSRIGYLGQHPEFIPGTLRENLVFDREISDEQIFEVFRLLECEEWLKTLSLEYQVKENGSNFSGGERLRLALARELLRDTDILLCDESAAHLDKAGRRNFYRLLDRFNGRKTVICVLHDLPDDFQFPAVDLTEIQ